MIFRAKSSINALVMNGDIRSTINPWEIVVNTDQETIKLRKRNWHLIGVDEQVLAFKYIRNIKIDQHMFGADIEIFTFEGQVSIPYISKKDANRIRDIFNTYNQNRKGDTIIVS